MSESGDREADTILRVAEIDIDEDLGQRLQSALQACFADYPDRSYYKLPPHFRYLVMAGGTVAAQMGVEFRVIRVGDCVVRTLGVSDLCVQRDRRSCGLASRLLAEVTANARACVMDFVILFADDDRLYVKSGWARVSNRLSWLKINEHTTVGLAHKVAEHAMMVKAVGARA
jgi:GNAT superfamily N-acetyltransferase